MYGYKNSLDNKKSDFYVLKKKHETLGRTMN